MRATDPDTSIEVAGMLTVDPDREAGAGDRAWLDVEFVVEAGGLVRSFLTAEAMPRASGNRKSASNTTTHVGTPD